MPTSPYATRTMLLLDNEIEQGCRGSGWLNPAQFTKDAITGMVTLIGGTSGGVIFNSALTPAALGAGQTDNYNPGSLAAVSRLRLSPNAAGSQLSGINTSTLTDGQYLIISNITANDLTLLAENAASLAANRFAVNGDVILGTRQSIAMIFDSGMSRLTLLGI